MASITDICNLALRKLGASTIMSIDDETEEARLCKLYFPQCRDMELRKYLWSFAIKRVALAASTEVPAFDYTTKYVLPSDFLRLVNNDYVNDNTCRIEGNALLSNDTGVLNLTYVSRLENTEKYDPLFVNVLALRMAYEMCERLTQNTNKKLDLKNEHRDSIIEAAMINAIEKPAGTIRETDFITARL